MRNLVARVLLPSLLLCAAAAGEDAHRPDRPSPKTDVGGANAPKVQSPPTFAIPLKELRVGDFVVRVPSGTRTAPKGGFKPYTVPGPVAGFKGPDGVWRGHGYLETLPKLETFRGEVDADGAKLTYRFAGGKRYEATLTVSDGRLLLSETSDLGPRNTYVFDCTYGGWNASAAFVTDRFGRNHNFLYLPCHYDKLEARLDSHAPTAPAGLAALSDDPKTTDIAGFWVRDPAEWENFQRMAVQLWQHRQLPGDLASRHFLGPETKSDSTPNPRTAFMLGKSLYEGHVTIELALGKGTRKLGFAVLAKPEEKQKIPDGFKKLVANDGKEGDQ